MLRLNYLLIILWVINIVINICIYLLLRKKLSVIRIYVQVIIAVILYYPLFSIQLTPDYIYFVWIKKVNFAQYCAFWIFLQLHEHRSHLLLKILGSLKFVSYDIITYFIYIFVYANIYILILYSISVIIQVYREKFTIPEKY